MNGKTQNLNDRWLEVESEAHSQRKNASESEHTNKSLTGKFFPSPLGKRIYSPDSSYDAANHSLS